MDRIGVSFLDPLDDYELIHRIGCGTYGDVFKVSENLSPCLHRADREKASIRALGMSLPVIKVKLRLFGHVRSLM